MNAVMIARPQRGFTLVEVIIVMVILGIISGAMVLFIRLPVQNYVDSVARADMVDEADTAIRRISREMRQALPNSFRTDIANTVEFIPSTAGGLYVSDGDVYSDAANSSPQILSFTQSGLTSFDVIGTVPGAGTPASNNAITPGQFVVVYNLGSGYANADAYAGTNRAQLSKVVGSTVTMNSNTFASQSPANPSPNNRFTIVNQPVMYVCANGNLTRYWNYGFTATEQIPTTGSHAVLAANVVSCEFDTGNLPYTHLGLATINIRLRAPNSTDPDLQLFNQIHVDNTP